MGGADLHCRVAKSDRRVTECRAELQDAEGGARLDLWISAVDSVAGVITLSGTMVDGQLESWRGTLERRYGRTPMQVQGPQRMMQWVRQGRMIRLTWRIDHGDTVASLSLVDGRVLDAWGRSRASSGKT